MPARTIAIFCSGFPAWRDALPWSRYGLVVPLAEVYWPTAGTRHGVTWYALRYGCAGTPFAGPAVRLRGSATGAACASAWHACCATISCHSRKMLRMVDSATEAMALIVETVGAASPAPFTCCNAFATGRRGIRSPAAACAVRLDVSGRVGRDLCCWLNRRTDEPPQSAIRRAGAKLPLKRFGYGARQSSSLSCAPDWATSTPTCRCIRGRALRSPVWVCCYFISGEPDCRLTKPSHSSCRPPPVADIIVTAMQP